ncbi:hypothetical protein ColKHC_13575 [Colletotrichum higginsianum]|nr:hypothetical protein ColKHC_13575 [Colletotrichum higginsianum]
MTTLVVDICTLVDEHLDDGIAFRVGISTLIEEHLGDFFMAFRACGVKSVAIIAALGVDICSSIY